MAMGPHMVVWIDGTEARIVSVEANAIGELVERADNNKRHHRSRAGSHEGYRTTVDHVFFQRVANDLVNAKSFMVIGPANAKTEFVKHLHRYDPQLFPRLSAVESADQMSDGELADLARVYFKKADGMIRHPVQA